MRAKLAGIPRSPLIAATVLASLAVAELLGRLILDRRIIDRLAATGPLEDGTKLGFVTVLFIIGLLCLSTTLPVAFARPAVAAIAVVAAGTASLAMFHTLPVAAMAAHLVAAYRLGLAGPSWLAGLAGLPALALALAGPGDQSLRVRAVLLAALVPMAALAGTEVRARREARAHTADRQVIAGTLLEHTARGERARIARELHDVVAHHISMISVQSETARLATAGMPPEGARQLRAIGDTARAALTEMRRLLGVLREDTPADEPAARQPQPGLGQLDDLLDEARNASGAAIRLIVHGPPDRLDPGVELVAYRIAQESLTNARRHAPGAAVDVELHHAGDTLILKIRDNGPGPPPGSSPAGHGLLGMRERAAAVGGEVRTGSAVGGGFLVEARLPATTRESR
ncbi:sensor histidine kinase [Micromonospora sp. CPCC 205371]|nr:sensor histidine kinase [Micromonospora sp. CPCC 205371]